MGQIMKDFQQILEASRKVSGVGNISSDYKTDYTYGCILYSSITNDGQGTYVHIMPKKVESNFHYSVQYIIDNMGRSVVNSKKEAYRAVVPREIYKDDIGEHEMVLTDYSPFEESDGRGAIAHIQFSIIPSNIFQREFQDSAEKVGEALDNFFRKAGNDQDVHTALDKIHRYWTKNESSKPEYEIKNLFNVDSDLVIVKNSIFLSTIFAQLALEGPKTEPLVNVDQADELMRIYITQELGKAGFSKNQL